MYPLSISHSSSFPGREQNQLIQLSPSEDSSLDMALCLTTGARGGEHDEEERTRPLVRLGPPRRELEGLSDCRLKVLVRLSTGAAGDTGRPPPAFPVKLPPLAFDLHLSLRAGPPCG
jgi:hypothetical protein